jgi:hypothetical protein
MDTWINEHRDFLQRDVTPDWRESGNNLFFVTDKDAE